MTKTNRAYLEIAMIWESPYAKHRDVYHFPRMNFWRDIFPGGFEKSLPLMAEGEVVEEDFDAGILVPPYNKNFILEIRKSQISFVSVDYEPVELRAGRFYPRGIILSPFTFPEETRPFRYLGRKGPLYKIDLNHPMAEHPLTLSARLVKHLDPKEERGGLCSDIGYTVTDDGPGLQASCIDMETDFFSEMSFGRLDESDDSAFYQKERIIDHIDERAMETVTGIYRRLLKPGMRVLDLMSSWNSHLPDDLNGLSVTGLGLNREEMERNTRLDNNVVHDLHRESKLPFEDGAFDAVICTVSVEYLKDPIQVFREVSRVLKPGAPFIVTFSNRWFPPKVITLWTELHLFERTGLVLEYFKKSGGYKNLHSQSVRGLPRPSHDKYFPEEHLSDPVFAVWGESLLSPR